MATTVLRTRGILKSARNIIEFNSFSRAYTSSDSPAIRRTFRYLGTITGALITCGSCIYLLDRSVKAMEEKAGPPNYPWVFDQFPFFTSLDHAAVRRGWQVYKTICSTCHSLQYLSYKDMVNVTHTEEEAKALAKEAQIDDGPDQEGNYFKRPGQLKDVVPSPYPNNEAAKTANNGAFPPDLTHIVLARRNGTNYVFSLLTGWMDAPAGVTVDEGQFYNAYFPGGVIKMGPVIDDGLVEYDDGTTASHSQMAKDVVEFLVWTSGQEFDTRKVMLLKSMGVGLMLLFVSYYIKRHKWMTIKSQIIAHVPKQK